MDLGDLVLVDLSRHPLNGCQGNRGQEGSEDSRRPVDALFMSLPGCGSFLIPGPC